MPCKDRFKRNEYSKKWIRKRRTMFFENKYCVKCGSVKNLELDHVDPTKKTSHKIWSWSKERFNSEIVKCQILCESCHKEKTKLWYFNQRQHGRTWYHYGCRCSICFKAQQKHNAQRNKNKPS